MSFDQDQNEQANISGADLAMMTDEIEQLQATNAELLEALLNIDAACQLIPEDLEGYLEPLSDALVKVKEVIAKARGEA